MCVCVCVCGGCGGVYMAVCIYGCDYKLLLLLQCCLGDGRHDVYNVHYWDGNDVWIGLPILLVMCIELCVCCVICACGCAV